MDEALLIARFESRVDRAGPPRVQRYLASLKEAGALKSANLFGLFVLVFETFMPHFEKHHLSEGIQSAVYHVVPH